MLRIVCAGVLGGLLVLGARAAEGTGPLQPGKDMPGPFHPYNVTGERKGLYHCQVSRAAFDPGVMLVKRGLDDPAFRSLLTRLDGLIDANPRARLHAFAVFLVDLEVEKGKEKLVPHFDDEKFLPLVAKLDDLARGLNLKHVVLTVAGAADLKRYALRKEDGLAAVLFRRCKIEASEVLPGDEVDEARVKGILDKVVKMVGKKE